MKKLVIILLFFIAHLSIRAQESSIDVSSLPLDETGKVNYTEVIAVDSLSADNLFLNSKQFFVDVFKSAKSVIQIEDKESKVIIGKGNSAFIMKVIGNPISVIVNYSIKIQSKDNRYKYEIYDISVAEAPAEDFLNKKSDFYRNDGSLRDISYKYFNGMIEVISDMQNQIKFKMKLKDKRSSDW